MALTLKTTLVLIVKTILKLELTWKDYIKNLKLWLYYGKLSNTKMGHGYFQQLWQWVVKSII